MLLARLAALAATFLVLGPALAETHLSAVAPRLKAASLSETLNPGFAATREVVLGALPAGRIATIRAKNSLEQGAPQQIGVVRDLPAAAGVPEWRPVPGGMAVRWSVRAHGARALRVRLDVRKSSAGVRGRFASTEPGAGVLAESLESPGTVWSPVIRGEEALVELFVPAPLAPKDVDIALTQVVDHFDRPWAKASSASNWFAEPCQADLICESRDDPVLARAGTASLKINWIHDGVAYACSATLLNPADGSFRPYIYTAAHCLNDAAAAANVVTHWFYDKSTCGGEEARADAIQVGGGAQLLAADDALDASFLLLNRMPPPGVTFAGWDSEPPREGEAVTALHHANGEVTKVSHATVLPPPPYVRLAVGWTSGIVQGGSSGSGLFTRIGAPVADLLFRGGLGSGNSTCGSPGFALYSRIDRFWPRIAPYLSVAAASANATGLWSDASDPGWGLSLAQQGETVFGVLFVHDEDGRGTWLAAPDMRRLSEGAYSGPVYRTTGSPLGGASRPTQAQAMGTMQVSLANANEGELRVALDGRPVTTKRVSRQVWSAHAPVCSIPAQKSRAAAVNYQDLWWNPDEPGWGIAIAHQGDILFVTLFTYDEAGAPAWYVASSAERRVDGSYAGTLYRTAGMPAVPANWPATSASAVGDVTLDFTDGETGTVVVTVAGVKSTRRIVRQVFSASPPVCH
jgi:hypothetical protein